MIDLPTDAPPPPKSFSSNIKKIFEEATEVVSAEPHVRAILGEPKNELIFNFPVRMDDGSVRLFKAYRIQHHNVLGPFLGGVRFHARMGLDEARGLSAITTWQCALFGLPFGGAFGGIKFNPRGVSHTELQRITRRFVFSLGDNAGPDFDVQMPDVGTDEQIMAWAMDTFASTVGKNEEETVKAGFTGKPIASGGCEGRRSATGRGLVTCIEAWAKEKTLDLAGATMIVQGFGNVGAHAAMKLAKRGVSCTAAGDEVGYVYNAEGLNPHKLEDHVKKTGSVVGYPGGEPITRQEFFARRADILIPAALENEIDEAEARTLDVKLVAEGAYGPTTPGAEEILASRGIDLLPDILANAGGVAASYYEWAQNRRSESWSRAAIDDKLEAALGRAYREVSAASRRWKVSRRLAAYAIGVSRLDRVYRERDLFP
jgi:glutamate dehydrogenase (NAD(P)+)